MTVTKTYSEIYREVMGRISDLKLDVAHAKYDVVEEEGIFKLLHYRSLTEEKHGTPLLIVYAWINRPYVLDLQPEISVVRKYLRAGFDVYMIDWGYPTVADQYLDLDDYMDFVDKSVEYIKEKKNVENVSLQGYCLGGTLSAAYTAIRQQNVKNLILQAAPIDFHTDNPLALWTRDLDPGKIVEAYRMAPGEFLNLGFLEADPVNLVIGKYSGFLDMIDSDVGMTSFLRMDCWIFDSPAIPGSTYRQYITEWYQKNLLPKGEFKALGETVDLRKIECPLLVLAAKYDHIVPPSSQTAIIDIASSSDKHVYEMAKGHIGITTSRESHKDFWPRVIMWLQSRSELKRTPLESLRQIRKQPPAYRWNGNGRSPGGALPGPEDISRAS